MTDVHDNDEFPDTELGGLTRRTFFAVTRLPPICPGIRIPFRTRAGVALAPMEPGARTL